MSALEARLGVVETEAAADVARLGAKLDALMDAVAAVKTGVDHVSVQTDRVAKHVPFVDTLSHILECMDVRRLLAVGSRFSGGLIRDAPGSVPGERDLGPEVD